MRGNRTAYRIATGHHEQIRRRGNRWRWITRTRAYSSIASVLAVSKRRSFSRDSRSIPIRKQRIATLLRQSE